MAPKTETETPAQVAARLAQDSAEADERARKANAELAAFQLAQEDARRTRLEDHARLTLAAHDGDVQAATDALSAARQAFQDAAPTPDAPKRYLDVRRAQFELAHVYRRRTDARGRLGENEQLSIPVRQFQSEPYSSALDRALDWHAAALSAELDDAYHAELAAVVADE